MSSSKMHRDPYFSEYRNEILDKLMKDLNLNSQQAAKLWRDTRMEMNHYNRILYKAYKETGFATCEVKKAPNKTLFCVKKRTISIDNEGIKTEHKYLEPTAEPRKLTEGAKAEIRSRYYHNNSSIVQLSNEFGLRPSEVMTIATSEGFLFRKTLERNCPKCGELLTYQTECGYKRANTENSVCRNCSCAGKTRKDLIGENNPNAVLDFEDVRLIRGRFSSGSKYNELAEEFGVSELTIRRVANRITYKEETVQ
jgi:transposase